MMQGWYCVKSLTGQWHDRVQTEANICNRRQLFRPCWVSSVRRSKLYKGFILPDKLIHLSKTRVSNARGAPRGTLMPSPRAAIKLRMPHPRDWQREQMPRGCPGGGGGVGTAGIDWCITLSNAVLLRVYYSHFPPFSKATLSHEHWQAWLTESLPTNQSWLIVDSKRNLFQVQLTTCLNVA